MARIDSPRRSLQVAPCALALLAFLAAPGEGRAQEPASCLSPDPSQWPPAAKPYFMIIVDSSGSMGGAVGSNPSCAGYQGNRIGHARCAVKNTVTAYSGEVSFGLSTYAWRESSCQNKLCGTCAAGSCFTECVPQYAPGDNNFCGPMVAEPTLGINVHAGANVVVPLLQDHYWSSPPDPSNVPAIQALVDNNCGNGEIGANSNTPLGGVLFNMNQYFGGTFKDPFTGQTLPSPIGPATYGGKPAERSCRSINVILITDGDETCDFHDTAAYPNGEGLAAYEAGRLYANGVTVSGQTFKIKTYVIGFIGATTLALDNIAAAGGTAKSFSTANETQLSQALANIIAGSIKPEVCDNADNNCNGCTDEGFPHFCNVSPGRCCTSSRAVCLAQYQASITAANPKGDLTKLPCVTAQQASSPASWLCFDPGEVCDNLDNDCNGQVDEGIVKCGSPPHCPQAETCNGQDDNCNGLIDEGNVCPLTCPSISAEVCDGCDNDCDGFTDNGVAPVPCGPTGPGEPSWCQGLMACKPPVAVPKGTCVMGGGFGGCNNAPRQEVCNGLDDDCNGIVDDLPPTPCVPAGTPPGLVYDDGTNRSQCKKGTLSCFNGVATCQGFFGPSAELCDDIDNDCNGLVDDNAVGVNKPCGVNQAPCTPGLTACVNGALVCQGGVQPRPETCNGLDDDCNGLVDDGPLADAPAAGHGGCWQQAGNCCSFGALTWCPPAGATCHGIGALTSPCGAGTLTCRAGAWTCANAVPPSPEICDGADNDCNGSIDDGLLPAVGNLCGSDVGECRPGAIVCSAGALVCVGGVGPAPETCDGKDNDCNGVIDDGVSTTAPCSPPYDPVLFPGDRTHSPCRPGTLQCDGLGGFVCVGGRGPEPEVCDGVDNDCDGQIDETGPAPDGIDGSLNPLPPPAARVGDACGVDIGVCKKGSYACVDGSLACLGGQGQEPETCDCKDNDCDGLVDNGTPASPICGAGKDCVRSPLGCQCAAPCDPGSEFPCPGGQTCVPAESSQTGAPLGNYCVSDPCGDCSTRTVKDGAGNLVCAPAGTTGAGCPSVPQCVCKGQSGCQDPCAGVVCPAPGTACARIGANAGSCATEDCTNQGCTGCGLVCQPTADGGHHCIDGGVGGSSSSSDAGTASAGGDADAVWGLATGGGGCSCETGGSTGEGAGCWALLLVATILARRRSKRTTGLACAAALASAGAAGCTTNAFCFDRCGDEPTSSGTTAGVGGMVGTGIGSGGADCFPYCADTDGGCTPTNGGVEICDGIDNDCNGLVDEGFDLTTAKRCGSCDADCFAIPGTNWDPSSITCVAPGSCRGACAQDYWDLDHDPAGTCEYYCVKTADSDTTCDGRDDDCNGLVDDGVDLCSSITDCGGCGRACSVLHGKPKCVHSGPGSCDQSTHCEIESCDCAGPGDCWWDLDGSLATGCEYRCDLTDGGAGLGVEACGDGIDNDCDGKIDEADDLSGDPRLGVPCFGGAAGVCVEPAHAGVTQCAHHAIVCAGPAVVRPGERPERCNGLDDDCNGLVDDGPVDAGAACGTSNIFPCKKGALQCQGGTLVCIGAVDPKPELCNGIDDDCNGTIDDAPTDLAGPCDVPPAPPPGATSACQAGVKACVGGALRCQGSIKPVPGALDRCGVDADCDGHLDNQPDLTSDVHNCGACGHDCLAGAVHARWACQVVSGAPTCVFQGCQSGYYDLSVPKDDKCEYACTFVSAQESCNGIDDNCDGRIDEGVAPPSPVQVCGVSPQATAPECTAMVSIACVNGGWKCAFPASVCDGGLPPSCAGTPEICDGLDNNCNGLVNENVPGFGKPCASDDGLPPPGDGACRTTGTMVCNGPTAVRCSAAKDLTKAGPELCDGVDNDCDGLIDESFANKGGNAAFFVKPAVTKVGPSLWIYSHEASRPRATATVPGSGDGYYCKAFNAIDPRCNDAAIPLAPAGVTLDQTPSCSVPGKIPWFNVTPIEAEQTCKAAGGHLCTKTEWVAACSISPPSATACVWGYAPRGAACSTASGPPYPPPASAGAWCNLGPSFDFAPATAGDQDGLLVTGSASLKNCWADWSGLYGNTAASAKLFDMTGNLREITKSGSGAYALMGGSFASGDENGGACGFSFYSVDASFQLYDLGFRCCFSSDPTL